MSFDFDFDLLLLRLVCHFIDEWRKLLYWSFDRRILPERKPINMETKKLPNSQLHEKVRKNGFSFKLNFYVKVFVFLEMIIATKAKNRLTVLWTKSFGRRLILWPSLMNLFYVLHHQLLILNERCSKDNKCSLFKRTDNKELRCLVDWCNYWSDSVNWIKST